MVETTLVCDFVIRWPSWFAYADIHSTKGHINLCAGTDFARESYYQILRQAGEVIEVVAVCMFQRGETSS